MEFASFSNDATLSDKMNLDELYDVKREMKRQEEETYRQVLGNVHAKIRETASQMGEQQHCFFIFPEVLLGSPMYSKMPCITYVVEKLVDNGFHVKYTHPNLLFISWKHYIPTHVRQEYKKKTGITIDGFGKVIKVDEDKQQKMENEMDGLMFTGGTRIAPMDPAIQVRPQKKSTEEYKPTGNLIYGDDIVERLNKRLH